MPDILAGKKTYIAAVLLALVGITEGWLGIDIPGVTLGDNWVMALLSAFGLGSLRNAVGK
jgi:hypothetical protein